MTREAGSVGIGARLRAARERRGFTVLQAAEKLHVDARVLEALEADNFAPLGADVYVRGHLRRYAELVGESATQLQELYAAAAPAARPDLTRIPRGARPGEASRFMLPAMVAVVGLALLGLVWWLLTLPGARPQPLPPPPPPLAASEAPGTADASPAPAAAAPAAPAARSAPVAPGALQLRLQFSGDSWVQVHDAHGRTLLEGVQASGSMRALSGAAPLRVVLGNAPVVAVEVNGQPVVLGALVRRRGDAHFTVEASGALSATPAAGAGG